MGPQGRYLEVGQPALDQRSDIELMTAVRDGHVPALGTLFDRHHRSVFRFLCGLTGDRALAEDLTQEVFTKMLRFSHHYKPSGEFRGWMFTLARNAVRDAYRSRSRREQELRESPPEVIDSSAGPSDQLLHAESLARVQRALAALPGDRREILLLARVAELPHEEIARQLGCTVGAVKVRVHRALKQLQSLLNRSAEAAS